MAKSEDIVHFLPMRWMPWEDCLTWFPIEESIFHSPDIHGVKALMQSSVNGTGVSLRCRERSSSLWRLAVGIKWEQDIFLAYNDGETNQLPIAAFLSNYMVEFKCETSPSIPAELVYLPEVSTENIVILSHGFSPKSGPNYRFVRSVEKYIQQLGSWKVVVPDFRETYAFETRHGHSERVRQLLEEIITLQLQYKRLVLIGHSQGGAVSCCTCKTKTVASAKIVGLIALGSENPLSYDRNFPRPPVPHLSFIHASGDRVVHPESIRQLGEAWGADNCVLLQSKVTSSVEDCAGDDVAHGTKCIQLFVVESPSKSF